jgi:hypothetical protein
MKAEQIEELNQAVGGSSLYLSGATIKELFEKLNQPCIETTDHLPLVDTEIYSLSEIGCWKVE